MRLRQVLSAALTAAMLLLTGCAGIPAQTATTVTVTRTIASNQDPVAPTNIPHDGPTDVIAKDGTYRVDVDVQPGNYKTDGPADDTSTCMWWRLRDLNGDAASTIDIGVENGSAFVAIQPSDVAFKTSSCGPWRKIG